MHDPMTLVGRIRLPVVGEIVNVWHVDPENDGTDDSCDWFGRKRPLNEYEKALRDAIWRAQSIFGNPPFYPGPAYDAYREIHQASYEWRRRRGFRWHPRWHVHHWKVNVVPARLLYRWLFVRCAGCGNRLPWRGPTIADWGGANPRHMNCDRPNAKTLGESRAA